MTWLQLSVDVLEAFADACGSVDRSVEFHSLAEHGLYTFRNPLDAAKEHHEANREQRLVAMRERYIATRKLTLKVCSACKRRRQRASFYADKRASDGLKSQCRDCHMRAGKKAA